MRAIVTPSATTHRKTRRSAAAAAPDPDAVAHLKRIGYPPPTLLSERLVTENTGLAYSAAIRWAKRTGKSTDELEGPALEGLIRGCRAYDPELINPHTGTPYALSTIVCRFINGAIMHYFRDHGFAVKLPPHWRENYGKVQRLLQEGRTHKEVGAAVGMSAGEIGEMIGAMVGTIELNQEVVGHHAAQVDADRLAPLQRQVAEAWEGLRPADRRIIERWWQSPQTLAYPGCSLLQFHRRLKSLLRGQGTPIISQPELVAAPPIALRDDDPAPHGGKAPTRRGKPEPERDSHQLSLLFMPAKKRRNRSGF